MGHLHLLLYRHTARNSFCNSTGGSFGFRLGSYSESPATFPPLVKLCPLLYQGSQLCVGADLGHPSLSAEASVTLFPPRIAGLGRAYAYLQCFREGLVCRGWSVGALPCRSGVGV